MTVFALQAYLRQIDEHARKLAEMQHRVDVAPEELLQAVLATTMFVAHLALHLYERDEREALALRGYL